MKRTWLGTAATAILLAGTATAFAQTATTPKTETGGNCTTGSGADMTACQNNNANQQLDGSVGNGATPNSPANTNGIGSNNTGTATGTVGGAGSNAASGTTGQNQGATNSTGGNSQGGNSGNQGGSSGGSSGN